MSFGVPGFDVVQLVRQHHLMVCQAVEVTDDTDHSGGEYQKWIKELQACSYEKGEDLHLWYPY